MRFSGSAILHECVNDGLHGFYGKTLDGPAVAWLADNHPDIALTLEIRYGARVDGTAREALSSLDIRACSNFVSDQQFLEAITQCPNLEELHLLQGKVDLRDINAASNLRKLSVRNSIQSDADLEVFADLPNLESLMLRGGGLTDDGLRHFAGMGKLRRLEVMMHKIKGPGLRHLHGLKKLKNLHLWQDGVDPSAVEELKAVLPECKVTLGLR